MESLREAMAMLQPLYSVCLQSVYRTPRNLYRQAGLALLVDFESQARWPRRALTVPKDSKRPASEFVRSQGNIHLYIYWPKHANTPTSESYHTGR